jgi:two-component system, cell cycle response regulator DivK
MKTILIVEDIELNIDLLSQILEDEFRLIVARDGNQGIDATMEQQPDLILMDISLPGLDGYECTREIRKSNRSLPIIGLSAHAMQGDADKALAAGCNAYLTKPIDEMLLMEKINELLN